MFARVAKITKEIEQDKAKAERAALERRGLIGEYVVRHRRWQAGYGSALREVAILAKPAACSPRLED